MTLTCTRSCSTRLSSLVANVGSPLPWNVKAICGRPRSPCPISVAGIPTGFTCRLWLAVGVGVGVGPARLDRWTVALLEARVGSGDSGGAELPRTAPRLHAVAQAATTARKPFRNSVLL